MTNRRRSVEEVESSESEDCDTESEMDYELDVDSCNEMLSTISENHRVTEVGLNNAYKNQRGMCRITGMPFGEGIYKATVAKRIFKDEMSDSNVILVIDVVDKMRFASGMNWSMFVRTLQILGKEAEM